MRALQMGPALPTYKCLAAPYEGAMLIEDFCRRRGTRDRIEIGFYAEPTPEEVDLRGPERVWHGAKVAFEK